MQNDDGMKSGVMSSPDYSPMGDDEKEGFVKKVYGIVTIQLTITFLIVYLASAWTPFGNFCTTVPVLVFAIIGFICFLIMAMCVANKVPWNYVALFGFTFSMSFLLSSITAYCDPSDVMKAIILTVIMSFSLTIFALAAGRHAVLLSFFALIFVVCLAEFFIVALWFTPRADNSWLLSTYFALISLVYGCVLVIDTYIMKEGSKVDDYIVASILIYLDIVKIFIYILAAIASSKK